MAEVKAVGSGAEVREVMADKGYHSNETALELKELGLRGYLSETDWGRRNWKGKNRKYQAPVYANQRRIRGRQGRRLQRRRSELVVRPFAHRRTTGGLRRIFVPGHFGKNGAWNSDGRKSTKAIVFRCADSRRASGMLDYSFSKQSSTPGPRKRN